MSTFVDDTIYENESLVVQPNTYNNIGIATENYNQLDCKMAFPTKKYESSSSIDNNNAKYSKTMLEKVLLPNDDDDEYDDFSTNKSATITTTTTRTTNTSPVAANKIVIKPHQEEQWMAKYKELVLFQKEYGHTAVSKKRYNKNDDNKKCSSSHNNNYIGLLLWVKRQRQQYKLYKCGKPSRLSKQRLKLLQQINFIWEGHEVSWNEHLQSLIEFRNEYHHCNVPIAYTNRRLAVWVKRQRRYYKLYFEGKSTNMTPERILQLENIGFQWSLRGK